LPDFELLGSLRSRDERVARKAALARWAKTREKAQQKDLQDKT
jgi:hypothetical protein